MRKKIKEAGKQIISERANGRCEYCKSLQKYSPQPFVNEHIIPIVVGGTNELDNLAFSCGGCNGHKYTKTTGIDPVSNKVTPLFNPRLDIWDMNFQWSADNLALIGITEIGRATINALQLNRLNVINLRILTSMTDEHPPER